MEFLNIIGSIFMFFLFVAWIWVVISVITDIFRSHDLDGWGKGLWMMFVIILPWLGVLAYLIFRGDGMQKRSMKAMEEAAKAQQAYIQNVAGVSTTDELTKLAALKESGVITESEFKDQKAKLLK
jgi:hypothetical protein